MKNNERTCMPGLGRGTTYCRRSSAPIVTFGPTCEDGRSAFRAGQEMNCHRARVRDSRNRASTSSGIVRSTELGSRTQLVITLESCSCFLRKRSTEPRTIPECLATVLQKRFKSRNEGSSESSPTRASSRISSRCFSGAQVSPLTARESILPVDSRSTTANSARFPLRAASCCIFSKRCCLKRSQMLKPAITSVPNADAAETASIHPSAEVGSLMALAISSSLQLIGYMSQSMRQQRIGRLVKRALSRPEVLAVRLAETKRASSHKIRQSLFNDWTHLLREVHLTLTVHAQGTLLERSITTERACKHYVVQVSTFVVGSLTSPLDMCSDEEPLREPIAAKIALRLLPTVQPSSPNHRLLYAVLCDAEPLRLAIDERQWVAVIIHALFWFDREEREELRCDGVVNREHISLLDQTSPIERSCVWEFSDYSGNVHERHGNRECCEVDGNRFAQAVVIVGLIPRAVSLIRGGGRNAESPDRAACVVDQDIPSLDIIKLSPTRDDSSARARQRGPNLRERVHASTKAAALVNPPRRHHARQPTEAAIKNEREARLKLARADPPCPPLFSKRLDTADGVPRPVTRSNACRWYGDGLAGGADRDRKDRPREVVAPTETKRRWRAALPVGGETDGREV